MAIAVTHSFVATGSETAGAAAAGKVVTSEWNAAHVLGGFGTGVATALAINVGSAGAPVLFNGALGTPSSGVATNLTGTASGLTAGTASAVAVGGVTGLGTGVATWLATPSYANLSSAVTGATIAVLGTAQNFTAAQTNLQSIAAVSTDGWVLSNTTAAAAGAQQWSPRVRWTGQGWKTDSTAASQGVDWVAEVKPVQGAAAPTSSWLLSSQINAGGYTAKVTITSAGDITTAGQDIFVPSAGNHGLYLDGVTGNIGFLRESTTGLGMYSSGWQLTASTNGTIRMRSLAVLGFCSADAANGTLDAMWTRSAAATIQQGNAASASPVAQTLQAQGSRSGTDNDTAGASFTFRPGAGTGAATPGALILQSYVKVASGSTVQTATDTVTLNNGNATLGGMLITKGYAIGSLPTGVTGAVVHVTDQITAPAAKGVQPTAGGAIKCLVVFDGTNWVGA